MYLLNTIKILEMSSYVLSVDMFTMSLNVKTRCRLDSMETINTMICRPFYPMDNHLKNCNMFHARWSLLCPMCRIVVYWTFPLASHPCKGGHGAVHLPTGFKGDPRDSISSMAFGRKVSRHSSPLQIFLPLVDSGRG